jgi:hypothetical protein
MTWTLFKEKYDTAVETCIPKYTVKPIKWRRPLWMNGDAIKRTKKKYWSWKRYMNTGREEDYNRYCRKRNTAQIFNNQLRKNFEKMIAREAKTKPKAFWRYVKSKTRTRESLSPLEKQDGQLTQNDEEKAELLNTYFGSVFTRENKDSSPHLENRHFEHQLDNMQITEADVENLLAKMKPDKSPGPDQIHPRVLRECCSTMAKPLTIIFRKSLGEGQVPMSWKDAKVTPIYKKGKKKQPCNYRPVSLTSVVCKIMEKMIRKQIMGHLDRNNLLTDAQYGFRNRRSTVLQLLKVLDHWTELLDEGKCLDVLYLDFSKAFDTVPHKRLLHKLEAYGIKGNMLNWITYFLTARRQQVSVNGILSSWIEVLSGIPQGSVLGPLLFILYINDLPDLIGSFTVLFADDTKVYSTVNTEDQHRGLQEDLNKLINWSDRWQLSFNADKCKVLHYGGANQQYEYTMGEAVVKKDHEEKDLGVLFSTDLKFSRHIAAAANKGNRVVGAIRRSFRSMDKQMFMQLYKSLVRGHLEYANTVWAPIKLADVDHLEKVQRRATKLVPEIRNMTYPQRLRELKLPSLVYRRARGDMIETYKLLHGLVDSPQHMPLQLHERGYTVVTVAS